MGVLAAGRWESIARAWAESRVFVHTDIDLLRIAAVKAFAGNTLQPQLWG